MFVKSTKTGERFKVLIQGISGSWCISYDNPSSPVFVLKDEINGYERIEAPDEYVKYMSIERAKTKAETERLSLIKEALDDDRCITDTVYRNSILKKSAASNMTTLRRLQKLYFRYLATGCLVESKPRDGKKNPVFDDAITRLYFSAKRHSLNTVYELMMLESFQDKDGNIALDAPTFSTFRSYYYRNWANDKRRDISRDGLSNYQRNLRPLKGSAMAFRDRIGSFQIDETTADIYVVSDYDRSKTIGRPNVYMAVDTVTQLIAGIYVGFDAGEEAVMKCIYNSAVDKVSWCKSYGIEIEKEDWPNDGLCSELITDCGREFTGDRMTELCMKYGITINSNPPFRPEEKSLVERNFGLIQESYKTMLMGAGTICSDSQERWAHDYREDAVLTLKEYVAVLIHSILAINSRVLDEIGHLSYDAPRTPAKLWNWFNDNKMSTMIDIDLNELYILSLPRVKTKVTRTGINVNKMRYVPVEGYELLIGSNVEVAYDSSNSSKVYVITEEKKAVLCILSASNARYKDYSYPDVEIMKEAERLDKSLAEEEELKVKLKMRENIRDIIERAKIEKRDAG